MEACRGFLSSSMPQLPKDPNFNRARPSHSTDWIHLHPTDRNFDLHGGDLVTMKVSIIVNQNRFRFSALGLVLIAALVFLNLPSEAESWKRIASSAFLVGAAVSMVVRGFKRKRH